MCSPSSCRLTALARPDTLAGTRRALARNAGRHVRIGICPAHVTASWYPKPFHAVLADRDVGHDRLRAVVPVVTVAVPPFCVVDVVVVNAVESFATFR